MRIPKAFTLLELLIVSSISAVVLTTMYSGFHSGIFAYRNIDENIGVYQAARSVLERINSDLRNSFAYSSDESKFEGENTKLSFLTTVDSYQKERLTRDYASVSYKIEADKLMRLCRQAKEALNDKSEIEAEEMAAGLEGVVFNYGYFAGDSQEIRWKDLWDDKKALPAAVKIKLSIKNKIKQSFQRTVFLPSA